MRKALSIVLAALLLILPVEQVLAQAAQQQEAVGVQQTVPSDAAARFLRVAPLTENAALLLRTGRAPSDAAAALFRVPPLTESAALLLRTGLAPPSAPFADAPLAQEDPDQNWFQRRSFGVKLLLVVVVGFAIAWLVVYHPGVAEKL